MNRAQCSTRLGGAPLASARVARDVELDRIAALEGPPHAPLHVRAVKRQEDARLGGATGAAAGIPARSWRGQWRPRRCCTAAAKGRCCCVRVRIAHQAALAVGCLLHRQNTYSLIGARHHKDTGMHPN